MSTQIQYKQGEYYKFTAARDFKLSDGSRVHKDTELLFDGTFVIFNNGQPVSLRNLQGAVTAGWLVLTNNYDPEDQSASIPKSAGVRVRNAIGGNPNSVQSRNLITTTDAEEQEVGNIADHSQQTRNLNANRKVQGNPKRASVMQVDDQEGVPVRTVSTPAKQDANLEYESAGEILRRANNVQIKPGVGRTRDDILAELSDTDRAEYLASIEDRKASKLGANRDANGNQILGTVPAPKIVEDGGFTITNSVGKGSTPVVDMSGTTGKNDVQVVEVDGIKITNTNGPKRANSNGVSKPAGNPSPVTGDPRRTIARSICSDFPDNYNFDAPIRNKIARLQADYDDRPDVIRAVAAAETDGEVKARLVTEFPGAFTG